MALEELRAGDASVRPRLEAARDRFRALLAESDAALERLFAACDQAPGPATLGPIRAALNRRKYISNLVQQVESESSPRCPPFSRSILAPASPIRWSASTSAPPTAWSPIWTSPVPQVIPGQDGDRLVPSVVSCR